MMWGCKSNDDIPVAKDPLMMRMAAPVLVEMDSTVLVLADYLQRPGHIDSIKTDAMLPAFISADSTLLIIKPVNRDFPKLSVLRLWSGGFSYSLLLEKANKIRYRYTFDPKNKKHKRVYLKGQMNEWNSAAGVMTEKEGKWYIDLHLFPGRYQYKLVVDGREISDPGNPDSVSNGMGGFNSLLTLGNLNQPGLPTLFTLKADKHSFTAGLKNGADTIFAFWENHLLDRSFLSLDSNGVTVTVPRKARDFGRSFIRIYASNKVGISNEVLVPLQDGKVMTDPASMTRADREAMILYFLMVDRFKNGNPENDSAVADPEIDPKVNYKGGDIAGITAAIGEGYFSNLGVNTIWISPVTQNPWTGFVEYPAPHRKFSGYHGYWPITLSTVDQRFGTSDDMKKMVKEAHGANMNVLLDYVSHHAHQDYPVFKAHPDWITNLDLPGGRKNIRIWDEQRLTTWFDLFLPTFDLSKPEVSAMVSDSALFWIKEYGIDGFRHDAAKHVPDNYWRTLTGKIVKDVEIPEKRSVYQIGETFGSRDLIRSYINPGMLDAQFEFNLYWDARSAFAMDNFSFRDLNFSLQQSFFYYGEHNLMGNITGNQDMPRFISFASGALSFNENDREAGWKRDIEVTDTIGYARLASLMAFNMTVPGIPVIYYGDEIGMAGAGDPDNRRVMRFDSLDAHQAHLKAVTSKLAHLRAASLPLVYGDFATLKVSEKVFVYLRSYFDKAEVVIFNKDKSSRKVEFELPARFRDAKFTAQFGKAFTAADGKVSIDMPGTSFEILGN